jgi:hypothetical protein
MSAGCPSEATLPVEQGTSDFEDERKDSYRLVRSPVSPGHNEIWSLGPGGQLAILRGDGSHAVHRPPGDVRRAPEAMEWASEPSGLLSVDHPGRTW